MAASRFRPPKQWTPPQNDQPATGCGGGYPANFGVEISERPVLRRSARGLRNRPDDSCYRAERTRAERHLGRPAGSAR